MRNADEARRFIDALVERVRPLSKSANLASWEAATTGAEESINRSAETRTELKKLFSDHDGFQRVRALLASPETVDPAIRRQLVLLDQAFTANQLPASTLEEFARREAELEASFYNFRSRVDGEPLSNNDLRERLQAEGDSDRRRVYWEASKEIGPEISAKLLELVRRRNEAAQALGFEDHYSMQLMLQEFDEGELFELLHDFRQRTDGPFLALRDRLDEELAARFGIAPADVRPWHWDDFFAQEAPNTTALNLDPLFRTFDHETFVREYFARIGLPVEDILARSDLYERPGKDQHAFCTDIDREGDVRILCNLRADERWMRTLLHELGHAVYDKFIPRSLPYMLRSPAHTLSTESIAMYFGRLTREPEWLEAELPGHPRVDAAEVARQQQLSMLIATRWMLVMVHFERELYRDPDREDLNQLWWEYVERYQFVRRPEGRDRPDWATKIHLALAPVYYHNYLLGELMASQLTHAIRSDGRAPGEYLREQIFARGATLDWNELLRQATGEPLSVRYFVDQFVTPDG